MADLSAGQHANIVLLANEVLHVESDGNTDVVMVYGGPAGTTDVDSNSLDFGPYGLPAKLLLNCITGSVTYQLKSFVPEVATSNGSVVTVLADDSAATVKSKSETVNAAAGSSGGVEWPEGVGRMVDLPPKRITTGGLTLSQAQSLRGIKGSTILTLDAAATLPDLGGGVAGYITVANDYRSKGGVAGQGVIEDLDIDATASQDMASPATIHGFYAPNRAGPATAHTVRNVTVYNAKNNGFHFGDGNDKLVVYRLRQEGSYGKGIYIGGSDCKASDIGSTAWDGAMEINAAAVEMDKFDLWRGKGPANAPPTASPTLKVTGAINGCVIKSGTIEGKTLFVGKNEAGANRYINSKAQFAFVHFKHDTTQSPDCYLEVQSADAVDLISCKFGVSGNSTPAVWDYLIKVTNTGGADRNGYVKIIDGSGLMRFAGRPGATNKMRLDCNKHYANDPKLVLFEWGIPGQVEIVPNWACDIADPALRTHIRFDGLPKTIADMPLGYLFWGIEKGSGGAGTHRTLDDGQTTFTPDELPVLSSNYCRAMRIIP